MKSSIFLIGCLAAAVTIGFSSCSSDEPDEIPTNEYLVPNGAYLLNQGNYSNKIEGALNVLDFDSSTMAQGVFKAANQRSLGSTPQCGIAYGAYIYIGVYESNTIEIIDRNTYKSVKQISLEGSKQGQMPRSMAAHEGKVYVSMYDGYLARLDTATKVIDASVKVGPNPEIIAIHGNNIYVPNSDGMNWAVGYGTTASIVSIETFKVVSTIEVPLNPYKFVSLGSSLYLLSRGDYGAVSAAVYKIESNNSATLVAPATMVAGNPTSNSLYLVNAPWGGTVSYSLYNAATGTSSTLDIKNVDYPSGIGVDPVSGTLLISSYPLENGKASYTLPGYVCRFNSAGNYIDRFNIGVGEPCMFFTGNI